MIPGRGQGWRERPADSSVGTDRHPAPRGVRPSFQVGLHLRRGVPAARYRRGAGTQPGQHRGDEPHARRDQPAIGETAHAATLIDGAGWHVASALEVPANLTLVLRLSTMTAPTVSPQACWQARIICTKLHSMRLRILCCAKIRTLPFKAVNFFIIPA
jgi:hypothetical protein